MAISRNKEDFPQAPWYVTSSKELFDYLNQSIGDSVDELCDVIEGLREEKQYDKADRLRTITGRLARLQRPANNKNLIREIARGYK